VFLRQYNQIIITIPVRITLRNQLKRVRTINHQQENEFVFHGKNNAVLKQHSHSSKSFRSKGLTKGRKNVTDFRMDCWKRDKVNWYKAREVEGEVPNHPSHKNRTMNTSNFNLQCSNKLPCTYYKKRNLL
jgi:hypothetical protein